MSKDDRTPNQAIRRAHLPTHCFETFRRIFQGSKALALTPKPFTAFAREVKEVSDLGIEMAIIVGGGNIFRGTRQKSLSIDRATGDYMACWLR